MRIIAGKLKGFTLYMSKDRSTRPLKDLVKENIFNLLSHSNEILLQLKQSNGILQTLIQGMLIYIIV